MFAGWAALETRWSALEAEKATKAAVWLQLMNDYEAPEMLTSMKELRAWQQTNPKDFANLFKAMLLTQPKTAAEQHQVDTLDQDRRRVSGFFSRLETLCEGGIIDEQFARKAFGGGTYRFLIDVEKPMQHAKAEALLETKSFSQEDKVAADKREIEVLSFYARVLH